MKILQLLAQKISILRDEFSAHYKYGKNVHGTVLA